MEGAALAVAVAVAYAFVARRFEGWGITGPMVFLIAGAVLGEAGLKAIPSPASEHGLLAIAELTLALLLFTDASTVPLRLLEGDAALPSRMLFLGLPMSIVLGGVVAFVLFPSAGWAEAALVATMLAPTDVALGLPVVKDESVPARIRRALNVESGLNDGLATPFFTFFLAVVISEQGGTLRAGIAGAVTELLVSVAFGVVMGWLGGALLRRTHERGWTSEGSEDLAVIALALLSYTGSVASGGNGFVAAFVAGLLFGSRSHHRFAHASEFGDKVGEFAAYAVWMVFGAAVLGPALMRGHLLLPVLFAVLALTVMRMLPVAIALAGMRFRARTVGFMGWFGPRGLASIVFVLIASSEFAGLEPGVPIVQAAAVTVLLSVVAHGLTASPLAKRYGRWISTRTGAAELGEVPGRARS